MFVDRAFGLIVPEVRDLIPTSFASTKKREEKKVVQTLLFVTSFPCRYVPIVSFKPFFKLYRFVGF